MATLDPAAPLIQARGLTKYYDDFSLKAVSLEVDPGEVVGFIGKNGAGKTTTLKALLGLIKLDGGEAQLLSCPSSLLGQAQGNGAKEHLGVVFDSTPYPATLRVCDVAAIGAVAYRTWDGARFDSLARDAGLDGDKKVEELSRGMGMRLQLAMALSHDSRVLVLDEATAGLDPIARDEIPEVLRDFVSDGERGILMSSHITSDLEHIADRVVCIDDGAIIFDLDREAITNQMGVAHCRTAELEQVRESGIIDPTSWRVLSRGMSWDLWVPDRFAFKENFPQIPCDPLSIDEYMTLLFKGGDR